MKKVKKQGSILEAYSKEPLCLLCPAREPTTLSPSEKPWNLYQICKYFNFKEQSVKEMHNIDKENALCFNRLMQDHYDVNYRSKLFCKKCGKRYNTLFNFKSNQNSKCVSAL